MKNKFWLFQIPVIVIFSALFIVFVGVERGDITSPWIHRHVFGKLRSLSGFHTDTKFKIRGAQPPKNKIVIVEVDSPSIEALGRWPWHRDRLAFLLDTLFKHGVKLVGLDIVFSETDQRIPDELKTLLEQKQLAAEAQGFETDPLLRDVLQQHPGQVVLGWATESACQPAYNSKEECPVTHPDLMAQLPKSSERFAIEKFDYPATTDFSTTPLMSLFTMIPNLDLYNDVAGAAGFFNGFPDPDGVIRRTSPIILGNAKPYPSLPLEMARIGLKETLALSLNDRGGVDHLRMVGSGAEIPLSPIGAMEINFRGPGYTFPYVSVMEILKEDATVQYGINRSLASSKEELLKDAYVLIGISAIGVHDMRAFPFDSNVPGVEGHANILDNLLSKDSLNTSVTNVSAATVLGLMTIGAGAFASLTTALSSVPALLLFLGLALGLGTLDQKLLFEHFTTNWNTSLFFIELASLFFLTLAVKYVLEEKDKKFIKEAFTKYVSPDIVDEIIADPSKLTVGGQKRELTILFSDIRGFTTLSETMDAKSLSMFLNDYLGLMTDIVFEFQGTLDKYIGDAVMAFWGAPLGQPKHAEKACQAAIKMMETLRANQPRWKSQYGVDVEIGIGLNSGTVSVGNMGSSRVFEYTVIGDEVNLASRLEGLTKPYHASILTSRNTLESLSRADGVAPPHRVMDLVKVKGKKQSVEVIQLLDRSIPESIVQKFTAARALYSQQKFELARDQFHLISKELEPILGNPDGPSLMYAERCTDFMAHPPEKEWDGSWEMTSK